MNEGAMKYVNRGLPWRSDVRWEILALEAVVFIGLGIFMLVDKDTAGDVVLQIIGASLLVTSVMLGAGTFRNSEARLGHFDAFRAGIGMTVGLIATASWWSDYIENQAVRTILGWGLVAYSVLHLVGLIVIRGREGLRLSTLLIVAMSLVLGVVLLTSDDTVSSSRITLLGFIFLIFGVLVGALAWFLFSREKGDSPRAAGV